MAVTYNEGGIGRKGCPCGVFVPARTGVCPKCGHIFVSRLQEERAREAAEAKARMAMRTEQKTEVVTATKPKGMEPEDGRQVLAVASGLCPAKLEGTDLGAVQVWARECIEAMPEFALTYSCLKQWARQFHSIFSDEYRQVCMHVEKCSGLFELSELNSSTSPALP